MKSTLTRHNVMLRRGQMERLQNIYTVKSASEVIRALIEAHLREAEQRLKDAKNG